jgi:hypothetical protein
MLDKIITTIIIVIAAVVTGLMMIAVITQVIALASTPIYPLEAYPQMASNWKNINKVTPLILQSPVSHVGKKSGVASC